MQQRLQYKISNWSQAVHCLSNNSRDLRISVFDYLHTSDLEGQIVAVNHYKYGTLFAALTWGQGTLLSVSDEQGADLPFMTTTEILTQLEKFGFDIVYEEEPNLPGVQLDLLTDLYNLGYKSLTKISVKYPKITKHYVIAYMSTATVKYLSFGTQVTKAELDASLEAGAILNVSTKDPTLKWDWLTYTCEIKDILDANSTVTRYPKTITQEGNLGLPETVFTPENMTNVFNESQIPSPQFFANPQDTSSFHIYGEVEVVEDNGSDNA